MLLPERSFDGSVVVGEMSEEEAQRVEPTLVHLDMIASMIAENVNDATSRGQTAMRSLELVLKEGLGISFDGGSNFGN